jgi:hypothetical protein
MPMNAAMPYNIRQEGGESAGLGGLEDILVEVEEGAPNDDMDEKGNILRVEYPDGSIAVAIDGKPVEEAEGENPPGWFDNLVDKIDSNELSRITEELLNGIRDDQDSRQEWIEARAQGIKLLGLTIEIPGLQGAADGAPVDGMSKVRHPLLLEAVLRFQANSRSELLPTDGPVKVRDDSQWDSPEQQQLADALENDLNHYLTAVAKEYYPDTDKMLFMLGFGGTAFKKVYFCPLRGRPVSETVDADDLIVNNSATTLEDAKRVTHRVFMRPSTVKRLQILGVYRDVDLITPSYNELDAVQRMKAEQQGVSVESFNPEDRDREIYECYCELDIHGFEHKFKGKYTGLEIPYRVTIDASSREVLSIVRNYDEPTGDVGDELPKARQNFVKYIFVPGMGFYDIGLLHILGNTTNAVTAAWREMLDAGMYANFPGFLMADTGARQNTNIFRVPPGGGALVKTGGMPINQAIMPLPYKEPGQALFNLCGSMVETGQRVGGTSELQVGEGKQDAPVGTTIALIDQATKVLNSVHKRMHQAQAEEFELLTKCFKEHPESFVRKCKKQSTQWTEDVFVQALNDCELVPQADPNTASHTMRLMKIMALKQLQAANPAMYDAKAIDLAALRAIGWNNPDQFLAPAGQASQPSPEMMQAMAELQIKKQEADAKTLTAQANAQKIMQGDSQQPTPLDQNKIIDMHLKEQDLRQKQMDAHLKQMDIEAGMREALIAAKSDQQDIAARMQEAELKARDDQFEALNRKKDRESAERLAAVKLAQDVMKNPDAGKIVDKLLPKDMLKRLQSNEPDIIGE